MEAETCRTSTTKLFPQDLESGLDRVDVRLEGLVVLSSLMDGRCRASRWGLLMALLRWCLLRGGADRGGFASLRLGSVGSRRPDDRGIGHSSLQAC